MVFRWCQGQGVDPSPGYESAEDGACTCGACWGSVGPVCAPNSLLGDLVRPPDLDGGHQCEVKTHDPDHDHPHRQECRCNDKFREDVILSWLMYLFYHTEREIYLISFSIEHHNKFLNYKPIWKFCIFNQNEIFVYWTNTLYPHKILEQMHPRFPTKNYYMCTPTRNEKYINEINLYYIYESCTRLQQMLVLCTYKKTKNVYMNMHWMWWFFLVHVGRKFEGKILTNEILWLYKKIAHNL